MIPREEFKHLAIGHYVTTNPTAKIEEIRLYADGAAYAWDYMQKKQREADLHRKQEWLTGAKQEVVK
jgi:hypothetical protein